MSWEAKDSGFMHTVNAGNHQHTFITNATGSGADYLPPYITIYAWHRLE